MAALSSTANLLTLICIIKFKNIREKVTNIFIGHLSACDLVLAISNSYFVFNLVVDISGDKWLELVIFTGANHALLFMSLIIVLSIGIDRAIAVTDPLHYKQRVTYKRANIFLAILWSATLSVLAAATIAKFGSAKEDDNPCIQLSGAVIPKKVYLKVTLPITVIMLVSVIGTYSWILIAYIRQMKKNRSPLGQIVVPAVKRTGSLTRMTFCILIIFVITWLPSIVILAFDTPRPTVDPVGYSRYIIGVAICNIILHTSCITNCLVYSCTNPEYRNAYINLITCKKTQVKQGPPTTGAS